MQTEWLHNIDEVGQSPLTRASRCGRPEVVNLMIMQEAQDKPQFFRELPTLHRAACWGFEDVILELIEDGSCVEERDCQGETALHKAVRLGNLDAANALLENEASVNAADALGLTALHWAVLIGNLEIVELLVYYSANVYAVDFVSGGLTPIAIAKLLAYDDILQTMNNRFSLY